MSKVPDSVKQNDKEPDLILIRGVPGSGKSTLAKTYKDYIHVESDMYYIEDGEFKFHPGKMSDAHIWCKWTTMRLLEGGYKVVVSNTFTHMGELTYYVKLGYKTKIVEAKGHYNNIHKIQENILARMKARYESTKDVYKKCLRYNDKVTM